MEKSKIWFITFLALSILSTPIAFANPLPDKLTFIEKTDFRDSKSPDSFITTEGRKYQLAGIYIPDAIAKEAMKALDTYLDNKAIYIYRSANIEVKDKYASTPIFAIVIDNQGNEIPVQSYLIRDGFAYANPDIEDEPFIDELKKIEASARTNGLGIWSIKELTIKDQKTILDYKNTYQVVEAKITSASISSSFINLEFGKNFGTDFTVRMHENLWKPYLSNTKEADMDRLKGIKVRVRGWVRNLKGPMINIEYPEQLDIIDTSNETAGTK